MGLTATRSITVYPGRTIQAVLFTLALFAMASFHPARAQSGATFQPDAMISLAGETTYTGNNIYNVEGEQTRAVITPAGRTVAYRIEVQNDGTAADSFTLTGTAVTAEWTIRYFDALDGNDITAEITGAGWSTGNLDNDASREISLEITPHATVANGTIFTACLIAVSTIDPTKMDAVKAVTTVGLCPDLLIKTNNEPDSAYALNNVYQAIPYGEQIERQSVPTYTKATYQVKVENDTPTAGYFILKAVESTGTGWNIRYKTGTYDITGAIRGSSGYRVAYFSGGYLAPGRSEIITVEVSPTDYKLVTGAVKTVSLQVFANSSDTVVRDTVQLVTDVIAVTPCDLLVKARSEPDTAYALDNVYQFTPDGEQVKCQAASTGVTDVYAVKVENDSPVNGYYVIKAVESPGAGWSIRYKVGTYDITGMINGSNGYRVGKYAGGNLPPGRNEVLTIEVTPIDNGLATGSVKTVSFQVFGDSTDTVVRDAVQLNTSVGEAAPPCDLQIKLDSEPDTAFALDNVYQSTPAGAQLREMAVKHNTTATCQVKVENDTTQPRRFYIRPALTTTVGWYVRYRIGDTDITAQMVSPTGYGVGSLNPSGYIEPGAGEVITVEVTPRFTVPTGTENTITLNIFGDDTDQTIRDAVGIAVTVLDGLPPTIQCPSEVVAELATRQGTVVTYQVTATDNVDPNPAVTVAPPSGSLFPLGTTTVTVTATDASGNMATGTFPVIVRDTTPPVLQAPADLSAELTSRDGTPVHIGAATATDIGDPDPTITNDAPAVFPLGTTIVIWTATDASGNTATATQQVTVVDTTPPAVALSTSTTDLWPANHGLVNVDLLLSATDLDDANPTITLSVTQDEPVNGAGDGDTAPDAQILRDADGRITGLLLRAERSGNGDGRVYLITAVVTDANGNTARACVAVTVAKSQSRKDRDAVAAQAAAAVAAGVPLAYDSLQE